jgi:hypothetical protein
MPKGRYGSVFYIFACLLEEKSMKLYKQILLSLFAMLFANLLMPISAEASDCGPAANLPAGSYRQSCNTCATSNGNLMASCKKMNNQLNDSTLYNYKACRSGIENMDGYLTCNKGDSEPPKGSYKASCRNVNVEKNTLYASCRNVNGDWKEASLPLGYCNYEIYNTNGVLACSLPYGTYQRTCRNARVMNSQLYAECKTRSGAWANTVAPAACNRDLANDDGMLRCL